MSSGGVIQMIPEKVSSALAEVMFKTDIAPYLIGHRGLGKTSIYGDVRRKYGEKLVNAGLIDDESEVELRFIYTAQMADGGDLLGLPDKRDGITFFARNEMFPTNADVESGRCARYGVLVFDEPNRGTRETIQALFQILVSGELGPHKLADGWRVGLAGNPETGDYIVNTMDEAFWDRVMLIRFENTPRDWAVYAKKKGLHRGLVDFVEAEGDLMRKAVSGDFKLPVKPSYRSLEKAAILMDSCEFEDHAVLEECLMGIIGTEMTTAFLSFEKNNQRKPLDPKTVLTKWSTVKDRWTEILESGDVDLRNATLNNLREFVVKHEKGTTNYFENGTWDHKGLFDMFNELPKDVLMATMDDWVKLANDKENVGLALWFIADKKSKGLWLTKVLIEK